MRAASFVLGTALTAMSLTSMSAPAASASTDQAAQKGVVHLAASCPPGTHWVEAGYARGGKWREAHCARDDGKD